MCEAWSRAWKWQNVWLDWARCWHQHASMPVITMLPCWYVLYYHRLLTWAKFWHKMNVQGIKVITVAICVIISLYLQCYFSSDHRTPLIKWLHRFYVANSFNHLSVFSPYFVHIVSLRRTGLILQYPEELFFCSISTQILSNTAADHLHWWVNWEGFIQTHNAEALQKWLMVMSMEIINRS